MENKRNESMKRLICDAETVYPDCIVMSVERKTPEGLELWLIDAKGKGQKVTAVF